MAGLEAFFRTYNITCVSDQNHYQHSYFCVMFYMLSCSHVWAFICGTRLFLPHMSPYIEDMINFPYIEVM